MCHLARFWFRDTTVVAAVNLQQIIRTITGSGATGIVPYRTAILNNAGTEYVTFEGLNQRVGIRTTSPSVPFHVVGQCVTGDTNFANAERKELPPRHWRCHPS